MDRASFSKIARLESYRLSSSKYWQQLNKELETRKTNRALGTVELLKAQSVLITQKLKHLEAILYKEYYRNLHQQKDFNHEKSHSGGSDL